jgi:hypoxanthine-guanine phosphoribosyltransferase
MPGTNLSVVEEADAKGKNELDHALREFGKGAIALCDVMDQGRSLTDIELLFIENHFQVVQMAYLRWKRKYRPVLLDPT